MPLAIATVEGDLGLITLNHDEKRNALSNQLVEGIITALADFERRQVRVVILKSRPGAKVWSAGHDVSELPESRRDPLGWNDPLPHLIRDIETFPAPVIAMIEGTVWGGACEAAFACDLIVAGPDASFAVTPAKIGVPYNVSGMVTFLNASSLRIVKEMAFTAQPITAERAERLGIVNHVVPTEEIGAFTRRLASTISANSPLSMSVMKEQPRILAGARPMSPQGFERVQRLRRAVSDSADYREGVRAFKEKRRPKFEGR